MQRISSVTRLYLGVGLGLAALFGVVTHHRSSANATLPVHVNLAAASSASVRSSYAKLPIAFESNNGETNKQVLFLSHGSGYNLFLTSNEAVIAMHSSRPVARGSAIAKSPHRATTSPEPRIPIHETRTTKHDAVLRLKLIGANSHPQVSGAEQLPGCTNYFIGNDPRNWRTDVPTYERVVYKQVYPGIDMVYYGNQQQLEYDWVVAPGADLHQIQLGVKGAENATLTADGDLKLHTACGDVIQHAPIVYQEVDGVRKTVSGRLVLHEPKPGEEEKKIGFEVAAYDHTKVLVIDPVVVYSTFLGGSETDGWNWLEGIATDTAGNVYVSGTTDSSDYPLEVPYQSTNFTYSSGSGPPATTVVVSKLNASGTALVYSTYLGGNETGGGWDNLGSSAFAITVDSSGNAYVTGTTSYLNFPLKNAVQSVNNGANAFVTELNASGSALVYSTYLGGSGGFYYGDIGTGIAVDNSGNIYIAGNTGSTDFPLKNALQSVNHSPGNTNTTFVSKINTSSSGSSLVYSTYLGGSSQDNANGIAIDSSGDAYIVGSAQSTDFPLKNAYQSVNHAASGDANVFVTEINSSGSAMIYSTYLGGSIEDEGNGIAVDSSGNAYITGVSYSTDFPTQNPFQSTNHASGTPGTNTGNVFITKIATGGSSLVYSTYLGGSEGDGASGGDAGLGITIDSTGNSYVTGISRSTNFPLKNAMSSGSVGGFITEFNASGSALVYSTCLGGSSGSSIAVDSYGNVYVCGATGQSFPVQNPLQSTVSPSFIARIGNYNWQTVDVAVGSDNQTRLLWNNTTSTAGLWNVNNSGEASAYVNYSPTSDGLGGWAVQSLATGADGITRLLRSNTSVGTAGLYLLNADNTYSKGFNFGPYNGSNGITGWRAVDVAVGSDNKARLLWTEFAGNVGIWSVDNSGTPSNVIGFGPYTGWTASRISAGSDGMSRLLWNKTDGTVALWLLNADNAYANGFNFGPYPDWRAIDVSVGSDNKARILWTKSDGTVCVWTVDNSGASFNLTSFGPYPGWTATKIASGSDGYTRLLWFKADGTQALWLLSANNNFYNGFNYGPY